MFKNKLNFKIILLIMTGMLFLGGCSPLINENNPENDTPLFPGDTSEAKPNEYMLYFQLDGENYLAPEIRTLTIAESKSIEEELIRELISGPSGSSPNITTNINENTRIVSVKGNEDILFVTLSRHFLTPPEGLGSEIEDLEVYNELVLNTRKMALYSIVNTVTELGRYSFVQFSIDYDSNGTGTRPTRQEMGFTGEGETQLIEPLYRNTDAIFGPVSSIEIIMNAISEKNWVKVLKYTSISENSADDSDEIIKQLVISDLSLLEYNIIDYTVSLNGKSAVVALSYTFQSADGTPSSKENVSVKMLVVDGIWKCSYVSINQILLGEYE